MVPQYITAREAAEKWNISQRRVSVLCSENRIPNVAMLGNKWIIPKDAEKPKDARIGNVKHHLDVIHPFIKWAGGKGQILGILKDNLPSGIGTNIDKYAEPFVGGGALLFSLIGEYNFEEVYVNDNNKELINTYNTIKNNCEALLIELNRMQWEYVNNEDKQAYYYKKRNRYNLLELSRDTETEKAALFIFLNKTCFNGLYRVNKKGQFNVPFGKHENPTICDSENLLRISDALQNVIMRACDYHDVYSFADNRTFVYIDPPYRPLNITSGFTSYTADQFNDQNQIELAMLYRELASKGVKVMLSNSDPHNVDEADDFFDDLYKDFEILRIDASRVINSKGASRGKIKEILIKNY